MTEELKEVFLHSKPAKLLIGIKQGRGSKYASVLSKEADCTYSHAVKILKKFEQNNLIEYDREGRKKLIDLTDHGHKVARTMERLYNHLDIMNS